MRDELRAALEEAAAKEKAQAEAARSPAPEADRHAVERAVRSEVSDGWLATLEFVSGGGGSLQAAVDAFVPLAEAREDLREGSRVRKLKFLEAEVARWLPTEFAVPQELEVAYRVAAAGDPKVLAARRAHVEASLRGRERSSEVEAVRRRLDRNRAERDAAQRELDVLLQTRERDLEALREGTSWLGRASAEFRRQQADIETRDAEREAELRARLAELEEAVEADELKQLVDGDNLAQYERALAELGESVKAVGARWFEPIGWTANEHPIVPLAAVPPGRYWQGNATPDRSEEGPLRRVGISRPFGMLATPVTQALWIAVMGWNPAQHSGLQRPVERVSWFDAVRFCNELSRRDGFRAAYRIRGQQVSWDRESNGYRLPTEAEWESAARGRSNGLHPGGDDAGKLCWTRENSKGRTQKVRQRRANELGLHDLGGNVWEWCWDWFDEDAYSTGDTEDPSGPPDGTRRVVRGGSAADPAERARTTARGSARPGGKDGYLGFRVARTLQG